MAKKMVHVGGDGGGGGISKKRLIKRSKKKNIHKVIDYLLSDCYLFAPLLISPSPNNSHTRGIEIRERTKDNRSLVKKIQDYLKSDCYMYASVLTPQSLRLRLREKGETGSVGYVKKVSGEVVVMSDFVEATVNGTTPKRSIYPKSPSSLISGERDPKVRRIVVD